ARGTCSRKLSSPSASTRSTRAPSCASTSDRQSPTGPAPTMITRSELIFGHHVLHGADPAGMSEVEHDAERILVLGLVIGLRGGRTAIEVGAAGLHHLLLGFVEIVHPHPEM